MKAIILVSHSEKISEGLKEMLEEMIDSTAVRIISAGGTGDGRLGTNAITIYEHLNACCECEEVYIFADIGSSILSSETAIEMLDLEEDRQKVTLFDAPLIEGAFIGAVQASIGACTEDILEEISLNK